LIGTESRLGDGRLDRGRLGDTPAVRWAGRQVEDVLFDREGVQGGEACGAVALEHRQAVPPA
jgi:hypothetical protein